METNIYKEVTKLSKEIGFPAPTHNDDSISTYSKYLEKTKGPFVALRRSSELAMKNLAEISSDPAALRKMHEELTSKNLRVLEPMVHLMSDISQDEAMKSFFEKKSKSEESKDEARNVTMKRGSTLLVDFEMDEGTASLSYTKPETDDRPVSTLSTWMRGRPYQTWNFVSKHVDERDTKVGPIGVLPTNLQENLLIRDILFCLSGINADYVYSRPSAHSSSKIKIIIDESADLPLLEMTKRFVPLFLNYSIVMSFIEENARFEKGLVKHAVAAFMQDMLKDYFILIAQLEGKLLKNELSMQDLSFYLQPVMSKVNTLANVAHAVNEANCLGGSILSLVHKMGSFLVGERTCQDICLSLAENAAEPFFNILEQWIYKGIISDPYSEFFVVDNEVYLQEDLAAAYSSNYWEKRYTIKQENIPTFLEKHTDIILRTGKYLNVVRQCGHDIECPHSDHLHYVVGETQYFEKIQIAYEFASKALLDLLMKEKDLKGRFRSLKHYFLLDQADFIVQFMDMAEEELSKNINDILPNRLETLFELALRTSVINSDKYKDDVKVTLLTESLYSQMSNILTISSPMPLDDSFMSDSSITGLEAFAFDYEVNWPLSLIINQASITSYQFLFRHLLQFRYVEILFGRVWILNKIVKTYPVMVSSSYSSAFALCQKMVNFTQNLDYFFTNEVIEPNWQAFQETMLKVSNVDEVLLCHQKFLDTCIEGCLISCPRALQVTAKLIALCKNFGKFMEETHVSSVEAELSSMGNSMAITNRDQHLVNGSGDKMKRSMCSQLTFCQQVAQYEKDFDKVISEFLKLISEINNKQEPLSNKPGPMKLISEMTNKPGFKMLNMFYRLDFSGYYSRNSTKTAITAK